MQKLITIGLTTQKPNELDVKEHLTELLKQGWIVRSMTSVGSTGVAHSTNSHSRSIEVTAGWLAVLLEKVDQ